MILKLITFLVGFIIIFGAFIYIHEGTHQQVNEIYGLDSKIDFITAKNFSKECPSDALACAYPVGNYTLSKEEEISLNQTQSINEIVGYSLAIPLLLLYSIFFWTVTKND